MATPPASRDEFEVALVCSLPLEYNAVSLLFDQFWDENGDQYGRAIGDLNTYTTGRFGNFDAVLVLLPNTGQVSAASATASLRSSYPGLRLVILTGICGGVPFPDTGDEILLGDVVISKTVVQYNRGEQYPNNFVAKDTTEDILGRPNKDIRGLVTILETDLARERLQTRAAVLLERIQDLPAKEDRRKADTYQYPGAVNDRLFEANCRREHRLLPQCSCDEYQGLACDIHGCNNTHDVKRQRLEEKRQLEQQGRDREAQAPSIFVGRFGSADRVLKSGEDRDWNAKRYGILAYDMEGAGVWDELPCIIVKGVCDYADGHSGKLWQNFAAATAASVAKGLVERYTKTDKSPILQIKQQVKEMMEIKENKECIKDLHQTDPRDDKTRIQRTKGELLRDSYRWILEHADFKQWCGNPEYGLLWIKGDPGKGKTMLLCGIIDEIEKSTAPPCLSYFFCQATEPRLSSATAVLRGLIYMIIIQRPLLISHVRERYDHSGKKLFDDGNAWEALSGILKAILNDPALNDAIMIVDALDECVEGLPMLLQFVSEASCSYRVKWIVSSRNWPAIEESLHTTMQSVRLCLELNEMSVSVAVQTYIRHKVRELADKKGYDDVTRDAVEQHLVTNAHGTFLWVALVCQELADPKIKKRHTLQRLKSSYPPGLDPLYRRMMDNIHESPDADICQQILATTLVVYRPNTLAELSCLIESLDNFDDGDLIDIIGSCGSFLTIRDDVVYFIHQSAKDFLVNKASDQILISGIGCQHYTIFSKSLEILSETLRRDIYGLYLPGFPIEQVYSPNPDPLASMKYVCIYWVNHFSDSKHLQTSSIEEGSQGEDAVTKFFEERYLYWLEALSLLHGTSEGVIAIEKLMESVQMPQLIALLKDAYRFILSFKLAIDSAPLQVYASALVFCPSQSRWKKLFAIEEPNWILTKPLVETHWPAWLYALEDHEATVETIAFSSDSALIASCSGQNTIRLWRTKTGDCIQTLLTDHTDLKGIFSLAFSHDSVLLASASGDYTIQLWNINTGDCLHILKGHRYTIRFVAFSFDSKLVASASLDGTIRLWQTSTGDCIQVLRSHRHDILSIAFSQDSPSLASFDGTIQLWDTDTGHCIRELIINTSSEVCKAAFSQDFMLLALALNDYPIQLWRTDTGECVRELKGQLSKACSVAFSYDSSSIASASADGIIWLWRTDTGDRVRKLRISIDIINAFFSHDLNIIAATTGGLVCRAWRTDEDIYTEEQMSSGDEVKSIILSHCSTLVASVSYQERMVSLWCAKTGRRLHEFRGHHKGVDSIAFSHDSALLASASYDETIRLWRTDTGDCVRVILGLDILFNIAFSHDSALLASVSRNETIQLWRTDTGNCVKILPADTNHRDTISSIALSHDSTLVAISLFKGAVEIKSLATGELVQELWVESSPLAAFTRDSAFVATATSNGRVQLWRVDTGECVQNVSMNYDDVWRNQNMPNNLSITSDNLRILTDFGYVAIDSTAGPITRIPAPSLGLGISEDLDWITWNNNNILRLPVETKAIRWAILESTVAVGCLSGGGSLSSAFRLKNCQKSTLILIAL